jgi:hypothetical protein
MDRCYVIKGGFFNFGSIYIKDVYQVQECFSDSVGEISARYNSTKAGWSEIRRLLNLPTKRPHPAKNVMLSFW